MSNAEWHQARAELKLELNDLEVAERTVRSKLDYYNLQLPTDSAERKLFLRQVLATETAAHRAEIQAKLDDGKAQIRVKGQLIGRDEAERFARPLKAKTINRHFGYLSEFYTWKIDTSGYSFQNPFTNSF